MGRQNKAAKKAASKQARAQAQADKASQRATKRAVKKQSLKRDKNRYMNEFRQFQLQLAEIGLHCYDVPGDGNCLFRAISHQMDNTTENHQKYRQNLVTYIEENREHFEWFIEDDEPFDIYIGRMRQDGQWGGQLEIQAASVSLGRNIVIHRFNEPRWEVVNHFGPGANDSIIHLSYHDQMHYGSVKPLDLSTIETADLTSYELAKTDEKSKSVLPDWWDEVKHGKKVQALIKMTQGTSETVAREALIQHRGDFNMAHLALENGSGNVAVATDDSEQDTIENVANTKVAYTISSRTEKPAEGKAERNDAGDGPSVNTAVKKPVVIVGRGKNNKLSRQQRKRLAEAQKQAKKAATRALEAEVEREGKGGADSLTRNLGAVAI